MIGSKRKGRASDIWSKCAWPWQPRGGMWRRPNIRERVRRQHESYMKECLEIPPKHFMNQLWDCIYLNQSVWNVNPCCVCLKIE
jgi:hypothetical protein